MPRLTTSSRRSRGERPDNVKEAIVQEREFENRRLLAGTSGQFAISRRPGGKAYRMIVVRKNISVAKGEHVLFDDIRYFFYITNVTLLEPKELVWVANNRCNQENLLAQLHGGVKARI